MNKPSKDVVEKLLNEVGGMEDLGYTLSTSQKTAYNYLVDYLDFGDTAFPNNLEGDRLFDLCFEIMKE